MATLVGRLGAVVGLGHFRADAVLVRSFCAGEQLINDRRQICQTAISPVS